MILNPENMPDEEEVVDRVKDDIYKYGIATFDRMIPSSFDGLKPVVRRIMYVCWENKIYSNTKLNKLGGMVAAYHPHGDKSITDSIVNIARNVVNNHALLHPEGAFGNISDMSAASPRYISTKVSDFGWDVMVSLMDKHAMEMIESEADFGEKEPMYVPTKIPLLLINGSFGIAESFTSDVPPHNLIDIAEICKRYIRNKSVTSYELSRNIYPDYVNGCTITNGDDLRRCYYDAEFSTTIKLRGDAEIDNVNNRIVIRSLPIPYDFDSIISKIKFIQNDKDDKGNPKNPIMAGGILYAGECKDNNNSSPYIAVNCKSGVNLVEILDNLYKNTNLQISNSFILTTNFNGKIKRCTIRDVIKDWYDVNYDNRRRKIIHVINSLENRVHILDGLYKVYDNVDKVIDLIRTSNDSKDITVLNLKKKFDLTLIQAKGIYEMQLGSLTKRSKDDLAKNIEKLRASIVINATDLTRIDDILTNDLDELIAKYGRPRRTKVLSRLMDREDIVISNGAILSTRNSIGIFDSSNIISGKKILNGFKGVKIDGKWVKEIVGSHRIDENISSIAIFYENGCVNSILPTTVNCWIPSQEADNHIKIACPIYGSSGTIVCITNDGQLKRLESETITNRISNTNTIIENCIFVREEDSDKFILFTNEKGEYQYIKITDIPIKGKTAGGVQSGFSSGSGVHMTLVDPIKYNHLVVLLDSKLVGGCVYTVKISDIPQMNRTNKLKKLYLFEGYTCTGVGVVDLQIRDQLGIFISETGTSSLKTINLRNLNTPRKITSKAFDFIGIDVS